MKLFKSFINFSIKDFFKNIFSDKKKGFLFVLSILILIVFLFNNKGFLKRLQLISEKKSIQEKIIESKAENEKLKKEIKNLQGDSETIEKIAREKYGMVKPGEKIYRVKPEKNDD